MKKLVALTLALTMGLSLSACGKDKNAEVSVPTMSIDNTKTINELEEETGKTVDEINGENQKYIEKYFIPHTLINIFGTEFDENNKTELIESLDVLFDVFMSLPENENKFNDIDYKEGFSADEFEAVLMKHTILTKEDIREHFKDVYDSEKDEYIHYGGIGSAPLDIIITKNELKGNVRTIEYNLYTILEGGEKVDMIPYMVGNVMVIEEGKEDTDYKYLSNKLGEVVR